MHPFGPREELAFLVGDTLSQICIDPFSLQFGFESGGRITAEFGVTFVAADGTCGHCDIQRQTMPALTRIHDFVYKRVADIAVSALRLDLMLEGGAVLQLHTDLGMYESVLIAFPANPGEQPRLAVF